MEIVQHSAMHANAQWWLLFFKIYLFTRIPVYLDDVPRDKDPCDSSYRTDSIITPILVYIYHIVLFGTENYAKDDVCGGIGDTHIRNVWWE